MPKIKTNRAAAKRFKTTAEGIKTNVTLVFTAPSGTASSL